MKWIKQEPTENGWYWVKYPGVKPYVVSVQMDKGIVRVRGLEFTITDAQWSGPLKEPEYKWSDRP